MRSLRRVSCWVLSYSIVLASAGLESPSWAAHKSGDGDRPYWRTSLFKRVVTDQKFLLTRWWPQEIKDPLFASTLGAGLAMVIQSGSREGGRDVAWESGISGSAGSSAKHASHVLTRMGNGTAIAAILGVTFLASRRAHDDRLSEASSLAAESLLDAGIWIVVLKSVTARVRPNQADAGAFFQYGNSSHGSFPSGHAMGAFSVASVFAEKDRDKMWVPWFSYGLATLVGASRLALGRHVPGDVIIGAVLGSSIGRGVVARSGEEAPRIRGTFVPVVGPEGRGVGVGWSYSWK